MIGDPDVGSEAPSLHVSFCIPSALYSEVLKRILAEKSPYRVDGSTDDAEVECEAYRYCR